MVIFNVQISLNIHHHVPLSTISYKPKMLFWILVEKKDHWENIDWKNIVNTESITVKNNIVI